MRKHELQLHMKRGLFIPDLFINVPFHSNVRLVEFRSLSKGRRFKSDYGNCSGVVGVKGRSNIISIFRVVTQRSTFFCEKIDEWITGQDITL